MDDHLHSARDICVLRQEIICFSGKIGSGKSSVSAALAEVSGYKRASFGELVRKIVENGGGDVTSRKALQDAGQAQVETDPVQFCQQLLTFINYKEGESLIIDGIRHDIILDAIKKIFSSAKVVLIHLDVGDESRRRRLEHRGDQKTDFERASMHEVESDLNERLPSRADVIIDANHALDDIVRDCTNAVNEIS